MGSLSRNIRNQKCRILLASFALILSAGLLSTTARAANNVEGRKLHRLETLGLDIQDPTIVQAADDALALSSVDVFPKGDNINVVLQLSGVPDYNSYIYRNDKRRLVLDLYNTINIAPSSQFELGKDDPILAVRNAQYRVEPSIISRVVLELDAGVTPEIKTEGNNLVITALATSLVEAEPSVELPIEMLQPVTPPAETIAAQNETVEVEVVEVEPVEIAPEWDADVPGETIAVPGVEVETEAPEVEIVLAPAVPEPATEETPVAMGSATKEVELTEIPLETLEIEEVSTIEIEEVPAADETVETPAEPEPVLADVEEEANHIEELIEEIAEQPEIEEPSAEMPEFEEPEIEAPQMVIEVVEAEIEAVPEPTEAEVIEVVESEPMVMEVVETETEAVPEPLEPVEEAPAEVVEIELVEELIVEEIPEAEEVEAVEEPAPIEEIEIEEIEIVEVEEVVVTMEEEAIEEILEPEAADAEPTPEEAVKLFGEAFSDMADAIKAEMVESVAGISGGEVPEADAPAEEFTDDVEASGGIGSEEMLVTLNFREAELNAVLDVLARKGALNIIAGKDIRGKVTVRLVDVPLDVALNAILNVNGFGYLKTDNIIRILPLSEIGDVVNMSTETYRLSYAKAQDAKKTLDAFLSPSGNIAVDSRTNMLVVTDIPGNKERLESLINEIDKRVQQVLIEVIILDSVLLDDADLGISWGMLNTNDNSLNTSKNVPDQFGINLPTGADALNVVFGTMFSDINLSVFIDAVVSDTDTKVLANPKILTLNNEKATIEIIQEFPYNDTTQTSSGGQLSNITFKEIGTKLQVRPQITHDDHVILWVAPEQNSIAGTTAIGVPIVDTRKAETTLIVKNHQTIVMGGLRESRSVNTLTKVPFFGDLPGVKYAFRSVQTDKQDTELLVFLTVHIMESAVLLPEERIKAEELANLPRHPNSTIELIR